MQLEANTPTEDEHEKEPGSAPIPLDENESADLVCMPHLRKGHKDWGKEMEGV